MKLLLTAFDPFGGDKVNPALEAVRLVSEKVGNVEVVKLEVPTVFRKSIATVATAIAKEKPDAVLCIGQAGGRYDITRGIEAAIAAIGDSKKGLKRLKKALLEIDKELEKNGNICNDDPDENVYSRHAKQVMPVFKAMDGEKEAVPLKESCGRICGEFAYIYPPGIPLLAPGEQITEEILKTLQDYIEKDLPVQGLEDTDLVTIQVMALSGGRSV